MMSEEQIETAWQRGLQMTTDEAVAYALSDEDTPKTSPSLN